MDHPTQTSGDVEASLTSEKMAVNNIGNDVNSVEPTADECGEIQECQGQKRVLELDRYINLPSIFNFELVLQASWVGMALIFQFGLINGGPASLLYGTIVSGFGSTAVAFSLAEMASMDPTVGAQYRWSAKFAPAAPKFWSLIQGWLTVFAWIFNTAAVQAVLANIVTALITFNNNSYVHQGWHTALLIWLFILLPLLPNIWFRKLLNAFEILSGLCCVIFFIVNIITLSVLAERSTPAFVFKTLIHESPGWTNPGVAWCVGFLAPVSALVGMDGVLHMSDEVKNVRTLVPYTIVSTVASNAILLFGFVVCILFTLGNLETVLGDTTGLPIIQVYYQATKSKAATNGLVFLLSLIMFFCLCNTLASVSRLTWAFARDRGLPFSDFFTVVHPKLKMPLHAIFLICFVNLLLSLITIGSSVAYNAIISLAALGIMFSYIIPISFLLLKKINGSSIEYGPFRLGRWGIPINIFALTFVLFAVIWTPWPSLLPVTSQSMNYAGPVLIAIVIGALADWFIGGRKRFEIPVSGHVPTFRE